ncbi:hypothetical protein C1646_749409 [Rhizophagus diaphanus]|nr:hypothetical protein C1646_749409 [Rhizophagus diaphanus] [Rhizophagus sp. MUCL 43196]
MQWIEDSIDKKLLKLYEFEEFKKINKISDGHCLEVYSAVYKSYRVATKSLLNDNNECMNEIVREIQLYRQLNYCSISNTYGMTRKDGKVGKSEATKKSRYVVGTLNDFSTLFTGNKNRKCSKEYLNGNFKLLYDSQSKESQNKFLARYVNNTNVDGPVIIINEERDLKDTEHKTLGKIALKNVDWIDFTLD